MRNIKKYSILAFLTLSLVAGIFSNTPSLYAQGGNQTGTTTMANQTQTTPVAESPDNDDDKEDDGKKIKFINFLYPFF